MCQDNSKVKDYYHKIVNSSTNVEIVDLDIFIRVMSLPNQEVFYFDSGIVRICGIEKGFMARMHAYVFSHKVYKELEKVKWVIGQTMDVFDLHRLECVVDKDNKGLQRLLEKVYFKKECDVENGVYINGKCVDGNMYTIIR